MGNRKRKRTQKKKVNSPPDKTHRNRENEDSVKLLTTFPEEVWIIILAKLCDNKALENISNASLFFRTLLLPNRVTFLFPSVWEVLSGHYDIRHKKEACFNEAALNPENKKRINIPNKLCTICGGEVQVRWYSGILKMRQVCKTWCISINDSLQFGSNKIDKDIFNKNADFALEGISQHFSIPEYVFDEQLTLFNKTVYISVNLERLNQNFKNLAVKFKGYFHECTLEIIDYLRSKINLCSRLREMVEMLENVKCLKLVCTAIEPDTLVSLAVLEGEVQANPFSNLSKLESLDVAGLFPFLLHELLRVSPNLLRLNIDGVHSTSRDNLLRFYGITLQYLKNFSIKVETEQYVTALENIATFWPLRRLELEFKTDLFISWHRIFNLIQKWNRTLTTLKLALPSASSASEKNEIVNFSKQCRLKLNHLTYLKLNMKTFHTLDFMLPLKNSLKQLHICVKFNIPTEKKKDRKFFENLKNGETIQFLGYTKKSLETSNIWKYFPKLRKFYYRLSYGSGVKESWCINRNLR